MRKKMMKPMTLVLSIGLVLGAATLAQGALTEVVVGRFEASVFDTNLSASTSISGTGSIYPAGGMGLAVYNSVMGAEPNDAQAAALAFGGLAESLGCTAGGLGPGMTPEAVSISCVCEGSRSELIHAIGELIRFTLTLPLEK